MKLAQKRKVVAALIAQIEEELVGMTRIAREAAEAASHEENRSEGDKDMRATEASYIARGQAERAIEIERHVKRLAMLELKEFASTATVESGCVIELGQKDKTQTYMMLPVAGGRQVTIDNVRVATVTPTSPLGSALLGLSVGDDAEVAAPGQPKLYEVLSVS